ncbi:hypothetical protein BG015_011625, partial [Linnemannia schmuckeri]
WPMVLEAVSLPARAGGVAGVSAAVHDSGCNELESLTLSIRDLYAQRQKEEDPNLPMYKPYRDYGDPDPELEIREAWPGIELICIVENVVLQLPDLLHDTALSTKLRELSLYKVTTVSGLLNLLRLFSNLTTLELQSIGRSLKFLDAELENCDLVLSHLPNLTEYNMLEGYDEPLALALTKHFSGRIRTLPTNPWSTMLAFESLTCRIVGVDQLTDDEQATVTRVTLAAATTAAASEYPAAELTEDESAAVKKFHRCQRQIHGVYDQLACLTRLKHLEFGYESRYPWTYKAGELYEKDRQEYFIYEGAKTFDTLELSLESGLDRLDALEDLELCGFECLNHRIGRKELDWMAKRWPNLNLM